VYGSLEFKHDSIGRGILASVGREDDIRDGFYAAIFDVDKIVRNDMDAEADGVMTAVYLDEVYRDYSAEAHRFGCSGIDGMTFAPAFEGEGMRLLVAYGIYSDLEREDNDYQVLLSYRPEELKPYEAVLAADNIHTSGPDHCEERYFVFTGNTTFGIQNLEYDANTGNIFAAVYRGQKPQYPNYSMYVIDGSVKPVVKELAGMKCEKGKVLELWGNGLCENDVPGFEFPYGSTGMISLGDGTFYFSENYVKDGAHGSEICRYCYTGDAPALFEKMF
jgi:hypothetical protein